MLTDIGRIVSIRRMGKIAFADSLWNFGTKIQLVFKDFEKAQLPKPFSIIRFNGEFYNTSTGQYSVLIKDFEVLAQSKELLTFKRIDANGQTHGGVEDKELKYRNRYIDLITNEHSSKTAFHRSEFIHKLRNKLYNQGFKEIETPILQPNYGGADAKPFTTMYNALGGQEMFLRISPELYLKRCIVGGLPNVFEIGKVFRNEGIDATHSPEFTMLEAYSAEMSLEQMRRLCLSIVFDDPAYSDYEVIDWSSDLDESKFATVTFVQNHLLEDTPLAKENPHKPGCAERFELFVNGMEIANAYCEQDDPDKLVGKVDDDFIKALRVGMPPTVGLGIGIDRVVMLQEKLDNIRDVILFPTLRNL